MHGWLKVAKKHWPSCRISEGHDHMDVFSESGELLVAARRDGSGAVHCAKKDTGAKFSLGVLQAEGNLEKEASQP